MELGFLNSSNDIIYGDLDKIPPDQDKFYGEIEPEKKQNESDMEIMGNTYLGHLKIHI